MNSNFHLEPTKIAAWQNLVLEAQDNCGYHFGELLESYLVLTLDHYTTQQNFASSVIAIDFLEAVNIRGKIGLNKLREIGDQCLLLSGLFPERAQKKHVSLNYFIGIGRNAYYLIAKGQNTQQFDNQLFFELGNNFVGLMDLLHTIRIISRYY